MNRIGIDTSALRAELPALCRLAWPVIASEVGWMAMWIVDTVMVGRLGPEALGAVSLGGHVFFTISMFGIGLLLGLDYTVATAAGARRMGDARAELLHGVVLATALTIALTFVLRLASGLLGRHTPDPAVAAQAVAYLDATTVGLLPLMLFIALRRYLQALERVKPILLTIISANLVNVVADWVLIYGRLGFPALGAEGAGWATCVSRAYMMLCLTGCLVVMERERRDRAGTRAQLRIEPRRLARLLRLGLPAATQTTLEVGAFTLATVAASRLTAVDLAAHQVALSVAAMSFMVPLGLSSAAAVRVGRAVGAGDTGRATAAGWAGIASGAAFMSFAAVTFVIARRGIVAMFTPDSAVIELGATLLLVAAAFQLFDGIQVTAAGALRGLGNTRAAMLANLGGHWLVGLPIGLLLCFRLDRGVVGMWIGLSLGLVAVAVVLLSLWSGRTTTLGSRDASAGVTGDEHSQRPAPA